MNLKSLINRLLMKMPTQKQIKPSNQILKQNLLRINLMIRLIEILLIKPLNLIKKLMPQLLLSLPTSKKLIKLLMWMPTRHLLNLKKKTKKMTPLSKLPSKDKSMLLVQSTKTMMENSKLWPKIMSIESMPFLLSRKKTETPRPQLKRSLQLMRSKSKSWTQNTPLLMRLSRLLIKMKARLLTPLLNKS